MLCAACDRRFAPGPKRHHVAVCTHCGHSHAARKTQTERTAGTASTRVAVGRTPSLPRVRFLELTDED